MFDLQPPRHIPTLPKAPLWTCASHFRYSSTSGRFRRRSHVSNVPKAAVAYRLLNWKERPPCKRHLLRAGNVNLLRLTFLNRGNGLADDLDHEIRL
jgi:hypothetical protein